MMPTQMIAVRTMGMNDVEAAVEYLARLPIEHASLLALTRRAQSTISLRRQLLLAHGEDEALCGLMFSSPQTIIGSSDISAIHAFARATSAHRAIRALIGPEAVISAFIKASEQPRLTQPRLDTIQHLYVLQSLNIEPEFLFDHVAVATACDLDTIVTGASAMIQEELGYDPSRRPTFRREILNQIQAHRWWIAKDEALRLLCRIGATTKETMQLECIWAPPESRGSGYATRALASICMQLLTRRATLSLAVNTANERAIRLYRRIGFMQHTSQRTLLW